MEIKTVGYVFRYVFEFRQIVRRKSRLENYNMVITYTSDGFDSAEIELIEGFKLVLPVSNLIERSVEQVISGNCRLILEMCGNL